MHKRISDEEKRLRSINAYVVLFVFFIMVAAGIICVMIYNVLSAFGLMKHIEVVPMLMPLIIMLCSCVIIGSILSAMLSGILLRPLNDLKEGLLKVSKGDFSVRLEENGNSELSHIQENFNIMVKAWQYRAFQKRLHKRLLTRIQNSYGFRIRLCKTA